MELKLGTVIINPEDEEISIPVDVYKGDEYSVDFVLANIVYQTNLNSSKPLAEYFDEAKDHARKTIKLLNQ